MVMIFKDFKLLEEFIYFGEIWNFEVKDGICYCFNIIFGSKIGFGEVIVELVDDCFCIGIGGLVKFVFGLVIKKVCFVKNGYEVNKGGILLWIFQEIYEINKDIFLLMIIDGQWIEVGIEVVKDIFSQIVGIVIVIQKNDILCEIIVCSGEFYFCIDVKVLECFEGDGQMVNFGEDIVKGFFVDMMKYVQMVEIFEGKGLLLCLVEEYIIFNEVQLFELFYVKQVNGFYFGIKVIQCLVFKDNELIKFVEGVELFKIQLLFEIFDIILQMMVDVEKVFDKWVKIIFCLCFVIFELILVCCDIMFDFSYGLIYIELQVEDGVLVKVGDVVVIMQIFCKQVGVVQLFEVMEVDLVCWMIVECFEDIIILSIFGKLVVSVGQWIVDGDVFVDGEIFSCCGEIEVVSGNSVILCLGCFYMVFFDFVLYVCDGDLVQCGDGLVLLVFECQKIGDIVQGLF